MPRASTASLDDDRLGVRVRALPRAPHSTLRLRSLSAGISAILVVLGLVVLVGWLLNSSALKSIYPPFGEMKADTALLFVLLGAGLWLVRDDVALAARRLLGVSVTLIAGIGLSRSLFALLGELSREPPTMSAVTATAFLLLGLALLPKGVRLLRVSHAMVLVATTTSFVAICGYIYEVESLYSLGPDSVTAAHTAIGTFAACCAYFLARPERTFLRAAQRDTAAGQLIRRLLLPIVLVPVALGWLCLEGQLRGYYDSAFEVALMVLSTVFLLTLIAKWVLARLGAWELGLRHALDRIRELNDNLERRVEERTREVAVTKERLDGILKIAPDAVISVDANQRVLMFNQAAERIFGWKQSEIVGQPLEVLIPDRFRLVHREHVASFARDSADSRRMAEGKDVFCLKKSGAQFPAEAAISKLRQESGDIFTVIVRDISERIASEERFRLTLEEAPIGMALVALDGRFVRVNRALCELVGYHAEELTKMTFRDITHPDDVDVDLVFVDQLARGEIQRYHLEKRAVRRDGTIVDIMLNKSVLRDGQGAPLYFIAQIEDVTVRKRAEAALAEGEGRLNLALESAQMGIWDWNLIADTSVRSLKHDQAFGHTSLRPSWGSADLLRQVLPEDREAVRRLLDDARASGSLDLECRIRWPDESIHWISSKGRVVARDAAGTALRMIGTIVDITQRKRFEEERARTLAERETLLREIHHRVKNNLQVVSSLFFLQSERTDYAQLRTLLEESRSRIQSIALVHEKLYQSRDLASIDFADYLKDLTGKLASAIGAQAPSATIVVRTDGLLLDIDRAIPCALIVNELVSNALKHGFPGGRSGKVTVEVTRPTPDRVRLVVEDTGVGLPAAFDYTKTTTLGMQLVYSLTKQLRATAKVHRNGGTRFQIEFPISGAPEQKDPHQSAA